MVPYTLSEIEVNGATTRYLRFGTGAGRMVILPGLSLGSVLAYAPAIVKAYSVFQNTHTVWLLDRREDPPAGYDVAGMAADTADALLALGIQNADILGISQGGMIAQLLALGYPAAVGRLVLGSTLSKENETIRAATREWIGLAEAADCAGLVRSFYRRLLSEEEFRALGEALIASFPTATEKDLRRFRMFAAAGQGFDVLDRLPAISCPVLVLSAWGDRVTTPEAAIETAKRLSCPLYVYPAAYGHAVYDMAPDYKARVLRFFTEGVG